MQVAAHWRPHTGQTTWVNFELDDRVVQARGIVVWATPTGSAYRWGIRFTSLHQSSSELIARYVGRGAAPYEDEPPTQRWVARQRERAPTISGGTQIVAVPSLEQDRYVSGPISINPEPSTLIAIPDHSGPLPVGMPGLDDPSGPMPVTVPFGAPEYVSSPPFSAPLHADGVAPGRQEPLIDLPQTYVGPLPDAPSRPVTVEESPTAVTEVVDPGDATTGVRSGSPLIDDSPTAVTSVSNATNVADARTDVHAAPADDGLTAIASIPIQLEPQDQPSIDYVGRPVGRPEDVDVTSYIGPPRRATADDAATTVHAEPPTSVAQPREPSPPPTASEPRQSRPPMHAPPRSTTPAAEREARAATKRREVEAILATTRRRDKSDQDSAEPLTLNRSAPAGATAKNEQQELLELYRAALKDLP